MPYIKISDPNIIDLAAWHQVINVVNQHSDSITSITNNFGIKGTGTTDWNTSSDLTHEMDPGSQKILYGKIKMDTAVAASTSGDDIFYGDINFVDGAAGTASFAAKPIVVATPQFGHTTISSTNASVILTVYNVRTDGFSYRVRKATSTTQNADPLTGYFYINWMAIGPKS